MQSPVRAVSVRIDRTSFSYFFVDDRLQNPGAGRYNVPQFDSAVAFDHTKDYLACPCAGRTVFEPRGGALEDISVDVGLIYFDLSFQRFAIIGHLSTYLMQEFPAGVICHTGFPLELGGVDAVPGRGQTVHGIHPHP